MVTIFFYCLALHFRTPLIPNTPVLVFLNTARQLRYSTLCHNSTAVSLLRGLKHGLQFTSCQTRSRRGAHTGILQQTDYSWLCLNKSHHSGVKTPSGDLQQVTYFVTIQKCKKQKLTSKADNPKANMDHYLLLHTRDSFSSKNRIHSPTFIHGPMEYHH